MELPAAVNGIGARSDARPRPERYFHPGPYLSECYMSLSGGPLAHAECLPSLASRQASNCFFPLAPLVGPAVWLYFNFSEFFVPSPRLPPFSLLLHPSAVYQPMLFTHPREPHVGNSISRLRPDLDTLKDSNDPGQYPSGTCKKKYL